MLPGALIDRIRDLNLDPFKERQIFELIEEVIGNIPLTTSLQIPADWPVDYQTQFWSRYPRKEDKKTALKALDKIAKGGKVRWADLLSGLDRYIKQADPNYLKMPATFLNAGSWQNEYMPRRAVLSKPLTQHQIERETSRKILDDLKFAAGNGVGTSGFGLLRLDSGDGSEGLHGGVRGTVIDLPVSGPAKGDQPF